GVADAAPVEHPVQDPTTTGGLGGEPHHGLLRGRGGVRGGPPYLSGSAERPVELDHGAAVARVGHIVGVGNRRAVAGVGEAVRGATSGGRGGGDVGAGGALAGLYVQGHDVLRVIVCPVGSQSSST